MITRRTALLIAGGATLAPLAALAQDDEAHAADTRTGTPPTAAPEIEADVAEIDEGVEIANPGFNFDITVAGEIVNVDIPSAPVFPPPSIAMTVTEGGVATLRTITFGEGMGGFASRMESGGTVGFTGPGGEVIGTFAANDGNRITGQMVRVNGDVGQVDIEPLDLPGVVAVVAITAAVALSPGESIGGARLNGGAVTPAGNATVSVTVS